MAKYKVKALSVGAMSNKIFHSGDIVEDSAFPPGHAEHLVNEGFLDLYEAPKADSSKGEDVKPETPADLGKELADKAKGAKTPAKK